MNSPLKPVGIEILEARIAPATFLVTNISDSVPGSLRQAILDANAAIGADLIVFQLPNNAVIKVTSHLPAITDKTVINGLSAQNGMISIDGSLAIGSSGANDGSGLMLLGEKSSGSTIQGLSIYGFERAGIEIVQSSNNVIIKNNLGITPAEASISTRMANGVLVNGGSNNRIGGPLHEGNVIGHNEVGIRVVGNANVTSIAGNKVGVGGASGSTPLSNDIGILVESGISTTIGKAGQPNTISCNQTFGIKLGAGANNTRIQANLIGLDGRGVLALGIQEWGIFVDGAQSTRIGSESGSQAADCNVITGNRAGGIWVASVKEQSGVTIAGNRIGTTALGSHVPDFPGTKSPVGNGGPGILMSLDSSSKNTISNNLISGNDGAGIEVRSFKGSPHFTITGNNIGTNLSGTQALGNAAGIIFEGATGDIGGPGLQGNTIVASAGDGILVKNGTNIKILGNRIGYSPNTSTLSGFGNGGDGIHLVNVGNVDIGFRGTQPIGNIILNNGGDGIHVDGRSPRISLRVPIVNIAANLIGSNGAVASGNGGSGIHITDIGANGRVTIGVSGPYSDRDVLSLTNVVGDNRGAGILVERSNDVNILTNYVGFTAAGNPGHSNHGDGIVAIDSRDMFIWYNKVLSNTGTSFRFSNTQSIDLAHNSASGGSHGLILENDARQTTVSHNVFDGAFEEGILISKGSANSIVSNTITAASGVTIINGVDNTISLNRFSVQEDGLPIDLRGDGVTPNDPLDTDEGPNHLVNAPILRSAIMRANDVVLQGVYHGMPNAEVRLEWYRGHDHFGTTTIHTDVNGDARISFQDSGQFEAGEEFSVSATVGSNTSEFSNSKAAVSPFEIVAKGTKAGQVPRIQLRDPITHEVSVESLAFGKSYRGGVSVALAEVDGDGIADLIVARRSGNPVVKVFSGADGHQLSRIGIGKPGSAEIDSIVAADLDGDGTTELIVGRANAPGGRVSVHDALTGVREASYTPFGSKTPTTLTVAIEDVDGDSHPEVVVKSLMLGQLHRVVIDPISGDIDRLARVIVN
jgi:hypothetical protein